ncbi:MAG: DeoR family transcriptional regulator [Opitutales bacterium]|nr:DeoR family transcriptional regulator [Opitutales bacterium]
MSSPSITPSTARRHARVRRQHGNELAQDYVEAVADRLEEEGEVRVADLQKVFGVSHVTVIRTLQRLEQADLVFREKGGGVCLTETGAEMASQAAERHRLMRELLMHIGVSEGTADADAEGMEHHLSKETMEAVRIFLEKCHCPNPAPAE